MVVPSDNAFAGTMMVPRSTSKIGLGFSCLEILELVGMCFSLNCGVLLKYFFDVVEFYL